MEEKISVTTSFEYWPGVCSIRNTRRERRSPQTPVLNRCAIEPSSKEPIPNYVVKRTAGRGYRVS